MSKNKTIRILSLGLAICLVVVMILSACGPAASTSTAPSATPTATTPAGPKAGGILKLNVSGPDANVLGWSPNQQSGWDTLDSRVVCEALGRLDANGAPQPWLADNWKVDPAAKTVVLTLKKGIKFQDGTDLNAAAVQWNLQKYIDAKRTEFPPVTSIDIVDDYTLKINMVNWDNTILTAFCLYPPSIVSPTAWKNAPGANTDADRDQWMGNNPTGTGAFMLVNWQKGTKSTFKKNPNYWQKGKPYLDGVEIQEIPDPLVAAASFQAKEYDLWWGLPPASAKTLSDAGFTIAVGKTVTGIYENLLLPNTNDPKSIWQDIKLRQALNYAINAKAIADGVYLGYAATTNQYALPGTPWYNNDVKGYPFDPVKAKQLVADAGYPNGLDAGKLSFLNRPTDTLQNTALQGMLAKAGINVQLDPTDTGRMSILVPGKWESLLSPGFQILADPALRWSATLSSKGFMYAGGIMHPADLDRAIADARSAPDLAAKQAKIRDCQALFIDKYAIMAPFTIAYALCGRQSYVKDDGLMQVDQLFWSPESAWLNK
jgi:peptide/nickel transport system substrate-binding protein